MAYVKILAPVIGAACDATILASAFAAAAPFKAHVMALFVRPDPAEAMQVIDGELAAYGAVLTDKPRLIVLNKIDLADPELVAGFAAELMGAGAGKVFGVSAATGEGIETLLDAVLAYLPERTGTEQPGEQAHEEEPDEPWSPL